VVPVALIPWWALNPGCALSCSQYRMLSCSEFPAQPLLLRGDVFALADHDLEAVMVGILSFEGGGQAVTVLADDLVSRGKAYGGDSLRVDGLLH
jgi:hypothetical protein